MRETNVEARGVRPLANLLSEEFLFDSAHHNGELALLALHEAEVPCVRLVQESLEARVRSPHGHPIFADLREPDDHEDNEVDDEAD